MEKIKHLHLPEIGSIKLSKSKRAQKLRIGIKPFSGIRVSVPVNVSFAEAEDFVSENIDWIKKNIPKVNAEEKKYTIFDENADFRTVNHFLQIEKYQRKEIKIRLLNNRIKVFYPEQLSVYTEEVQAAIRLGIESAWKKEAIDYLPERVRFLAEEYGFGYKSLTIKNIKSLWGSCSRDNKISLSLHLMRLPARLIDYVILHELTHTVEKNHGRHFWNLLEQVCENARELDKMMNEYRIGIY